MAPLYRVPVTWPGQVRIQDGATLPGSGHVGSTSQIPIWRHSTWFRSRGQDKSDSKMASLKKFSGHVATTSQIPRWRHSTRFRSRGRESHPAFIFFNFPPCSHLLRWPTGSKREGGPPPSSPLSLPPPPSPHRYRSLLREWWEMEDLGWGGRGKVEGGGRPRGFRGQFGSEVIRGQRCAEGRKKDATVVSHYIPTVLIFSYTRWKDGMTASM